MGVGMDASSTMLDGASGLPEWGAKELSLDLDGVRTAFFGRANGTMQQTSVLLHGRTHSSS
jgi:hypothetical protein